MTRIHQLDPGAAQILRLAARGWRLLPVESRGKRPLLKEWQKRATCDANTLCDWVQEFPTAIGGWRAAQAPACGYLTWMMTTAKQLS